MKGQQQRERQDNRERVREHEEREKTGRDPEGEMADWVTSLLAVTEQCCIAGNRTRRRKRNEKRVERMMERTV